MTNTNEPTKKRHDHQILENGEPMHLYMFHFLSLEFHLAFGIAFEGLWHCLLAISSVFIFFCMKVQSIIHM
jgi:hypothetical protein